MSMTDSQNDVTALYDSEAVSLSPQPMADRWTPVFIIASPRPVTGKTFLARLVVNFLQVDGKSVRAFELNPSEMPLSRYLPELTARAEIGNTPGQMALFDHLIVDDGTAKVVDLGHTAFDRFFTLVEEIGFIEESSRVTIEPVILYAADAHPDSVRGYASLRQRLPNAILVPVFNQATAKGRKFRDQYPVSRAAAVPLQIPLLPPALKLLADESGSAFADFHALLPTSASTGPSFELSSWTRRTFLEFRELELRLLLEKLRASLQDSLQQPLEVAES